MSVNPVVQPFLDDDTETYSYVVYDRTGGHAAVIDPVMDYEPRAGRTGTGGAQRLVDFVRQQRLTVVWIFETHAHADHLSAASFVRDQLGGKTAIGENITVVQKIFREVFNFEEQFVPDGRQFDKLFAGGETFILGELEGEVIDTPGHTPADMSLCIGDSIFVGDTLFMPDLGTARCDFPGGDAGTLYHSIQKLLAFPEQTRLFMCHDYPGGRREYRCETTVAEQKRDNIHVGKGASEAAFVALREQRDATLPAPRLLLPSIQLNVRAGQLPPVEDNGTAYFKIPINRL